MSIKPILKRLVPERYEPQVRRIFYAIRALWYTGHRFICPICGRRFRKFITKYDIQCPGCGSLRRHRLLWLYLKERTKFFTDHLKVLHVSPMYCLWEKFRRLRNIDYVTADLSSPIAKVKLDVTNIDMPDDQFDCIICYHVLEHIPDDRRAMRELFRVLKPGGWAILQVPVDLDRDTTFEDPGLSSPEERERIFGQKDHVRIYGRDYEDRLKEAGFIVNLDWYVKELDEELINRYGIRRDEVIYFCVKPKEVSTGAMKMKFI